MTEKALAQLFGANLKKIRLRHGYSQKDLALKLGVRRTHLAAVELGLKHTSFKLISGLTIIFKVHPQDFFEGTLDIDALDEISINYAIKTYEAVSHLTKNYQELKKTLNSMQGVFSRINNKDTDSKSDVNLELIMLLPLLSNDAQILLKEFAEGYIEKFGPKDQQAINIAANIIKNQKQPQR